VFVGGEGRGRKDTFFFFLPKFQVVGAAGAGRAPVREGEVGENKKKKKKSFQTAFGLEVNPPWQQQGGWTLHVFPFFQKGHTEASDNRSARRGRAFRGGGDVLEKKTGEGWEIREDSAERGVFAPGGGLDCPPLRRGGGGPLARPGKGTLEGLAGRVFYGTGGAFFLLLREFFNFGATVKQTKKHRSIAGGSKTRRGARGTDTGRFLKGPNDGEGQGQRGGKNPRAGTIPRRAPQRIGACLQAFPGPCGEKRNRGKNKPRAYHGQKKTPRWDFGGFGCHWLRVHRARGGEVGPRRAKKVAGGGGGGWEPEKPGEFAHTPYSPDCRLYNKSGGRVDSSGDEGRGTGRGGHHPWETILPVRAGPPRPNRFFRLTTTFKALEGGEDRQRNSRESRARLFGLIFWGGGGGKTNLGVGGFLKKGLGVLKGVRIFLGDKGGGGPGGWQLISPRGGSFRGDPRGGKCRPRWCPPKGGGGLGLRVTFGMKGECGGRSLKR